jgi:hypothetical protein
MPVKFSYDPQFGLQIEPELDSELSRDEAMIVAVRDLASGMNSLGQAMWELFDEFKPCTHKPSGMMRRQCPLRPYSGPSCPAAQNVATSQMRK